MSYKTVLLLVFIFAINSVFAGQPAGWVNYPLVNDITLPNGLRVMLIENNEQPAVCFRVLVKTGKIDNVAGKYGLAELAAQMMQEGTKSRTSDQIAEQIAVIGADLDISSQAECTIFKFNVLSQFAETGFDILADIMLNPSFPLQEFKRVQKEFMTAADLELTDNYRIASDYGRFLLFGADNPLGHANTRKSLKAISLKDMQGFYQKNYHPGNCILLVIGDFSQEQMLERIKEKFGLWKSASAEQKLQTRPDFDKKGKIIVVDKPAMTQAIIYLNQWAPDSRSSDYYEFLTANYVLGGSDFSSRLMNAVRAKGGKTYYIGSRCDINLDYGVFSIMTSTRNQELFDTYQLIQTELKKFINDGIDANELIAAKSYTTGAIPMQLESADAIANKILNSLMKGFTVDDLSHEVINYNNVSLDSLDSVIREYIKPQNMNVVIVGDIRKIKEQLTKIGNYEKVYYKNLP